MLIQNNGVLVRRKTSQHSSLCIHLSYLLGDKVCYFSIRNVISIIIVVKGKEVDWANILFKQL
jgi:hypothetical protein